MIFNLALIAGVMICLTAIFCWGFQVGSDVAELEQSDMAKQLEAIRNAELFELRRPGRQLVIISSCPRPGELLAILNEHRRDHVYDRH